VAKVSALYDVSRNHMVKVVNQLVKLGYLQSQRGKNGHPHGAPPTRSISGK
jgi:Rrf2 family nitric oxide-sensitive transcriptional repressor